MEILLHNFPNKKEWPTIILIGRDCAQLQKHLQYVSSEDKHQLAVQTPLGWTIMGKPADSTLPLQTSNFVGLTAVNDAPPSTPRPIDASEIWMPEDSQEKREHYLDISPLKEYTCTLVNTKEIDNSTTIL